MRRRHLPTSRPEPDHIGETYGDFSVSRHHASGRHQYVRRRVTADEATRTFWSLIVGPSVRMGATTDILVTDGGDHLKLEWRLGEGIVYPVDLAGGDPSRAVR